MELTRFQISRLPASSGSWVTARLPRRDPIYNWFIFPHSFSKELVHYLVRLTKLLDEVPADEGAAEGKQGLMDIRTTFIANLEATKAVEPGERAFDHPAVTTEALTRLNPTARDAGLNAACAA